MATFQRILDDLKHELHQAKQILERKSAAVMKNLTTLLEFTVLLEPLSEVTTNYSDCKIAVALPVSTAACGHSFSALKMIFKRKEKMSVKESWFWIWISSLRCLVVN